MFKCGLVSVSFRKNSPEEILMYMKKAGLSAVEWGSDIHAPCTDIEKLKNIAVLQQKNGISCCSYGTYFRLGVNSPDEIDEYIAGAKILGTNILRVWCGTKSAEKYNADEKEKLFADCKAVALTAEKNGAVICLECHNDTYTQSVEGMLEIMNAVNSDAFRMYWQPNQHRSVECNIDYAGKAAPFTRHIHAFQWKGDNRYSLADGVEEWRKYLSCFDGNNTVLLEFMPDDRIESLEKEAAVLSDIVC